ncbi:hypothetical protein [Mycobacterium sp. SMC-4]|uniref:hypothetical protein n=1 Tax=Mycobacterium sp. SMC-4 TaxID=2857059 RepID=UPI0021B19895|nr:hypothetical protein [Mycobacterium sp. SMC-4]
MSNEPDDNAIPETEQDPTVGDAADRAETETPAAEPDAVESDAAETGAVEPEATEAVEPAAAEPEAVTAGPVKRGIDGKRVVAFGLLPALALVLALGAGFLKWQDNSVRSSELAGMAAVQAAKDSTIALLSYTPDRVEQQLGDARELLTGDFRDSYTSLTNDVVIPGAKEQNIAAVASVPAAASVSADPTEAVVLVFVNQTVTVGQDPPTDTASSVRVTLQKVDDRWLISEFDPV